MSIAVFGAAVRIIAGRTIGGIGLCFGRSSRERNALVQRNILACSGGILGHQYGIAINGHTGQIGAHHLAQRVDASTPTTSTLRLLPSASFMVIMRVGA